MGQGRPTDFAFVVGMGLVGVLGVGAAAVFVVAGLVTGSHLAYGLALVPLSFTGLAAYRVWEVEATS